MYELRVVANGSIWLLDACNKVLEKSWPCSTVGVEFNVGTSAENPKNIIIQGRCEQGLKDLIERIKEEVETILALARKRGNRIDAMLLEHALEDAGRFEVVKLRSLNKSGSGQPTIQA